VDGYGIEKQRGRTILCAVAALATAAVAVRFLSRAAERAHPAYGSFVEVDGVRLHYAELGEGEPLVLLHGNSSLATDFLMSSLVPLAARRYRVLVFDRPGYGYSGRLPGGDRGPEAQARYIHEALTRLGAERPIVLGHSWGSLVAIAMALDHPRRVRALVLEGGHFYPQRRLDLFLLSLLSLPLAGDLVRHSMLPFLMRACRRRVLSLLFAPRPVPRHFRSFPYWLLLRPWQTKTAAEEFAAINSASRRLSRRYRSLRVPVVILAGSGDRIVDCRLHSGRLHAQLPGSRYRLCEGNGHMLHHQSPREVMRCIDMAAGMSAEKPG
jgi:pimeloyl-ACP methyl ester carboxylesterase